MPQSRLLDDGACRASARRRRRARSNASGRVVPRSVSSPSHAEPAVGAASPRSSGTRSPGRLRTSSSIVCWMFALSSSPSACIPPVPSRTRSDVASASSSTLVPRRRRRPSSVASQAVTWITQVVAGLGRRAGAPGPHRERRRRRVRAGTCRSSSRADLRDPRLADPTRQETAHGRRAGPLVHDGEADRRELRRDHRPRARRAVPSRAAACSRRRADRSRPRSWCKMGAMSMKFTGTVEVTEKDDGRPPRGADASSRARPAGRATPTPTVTFELDDGGGDDPHQRPDHRQGRVDGRGRRRRRARRADHGLHDQARRDLTPWRGS